MRALGVPESEIDSFLADQEEVPEDFGVLPENWDAVRVFMHLQSQWRTGPMGGLVGLDYGAVESVMRLLAIDNQKETFTRLQTLEFAALSAGDDDGDQ